MEKPEDKNKIMDYFSVQKQNLILAGLSVKGNEGFLYRIYVRFILLFRAIWVCILMAEVFNQRGNLHKATNTAIFFFGLGTEISKATAFFLNRIKIGKTFHLLEKGVFEPNKQKWGTVELKWLNDCVVIGKRQTLIGTSSAVIAVSLVCIGCYFTKQSTNDSTKWDLPFGDSTIIDATYSPNYEIVLLSQSLVLYTGAVAYSSINVVISYVFTQIATQCRILNNFIRQSLSSISKKMKQNGDDLSEIDPSRIPWKYLKQNLTEVVEYHTALIYISNRFEEIFSVVLLTEYLGMLMALCCLMYDASLFSMSRSRIIRDIFIALAVLSQVFTIGYYASKVITESELIGNACFEIDFTGTDIRFQKGWAIIIQRSQKPITFTLGKFTQLSVTVPLSMVKAAYSLFMVLRSTDVKNRNTY